MGCGYHWRMPKLLLKAASRCWILGFFGKTFPLAWDKQAAKLVVLEVGSTYIQGGVCQSGCDDRSRSQSSPLSYTTKTAYAIAYHAPGRPFGMMFSCSDMPLPISFNAFCILLLQLSLDAKYQVDRGATFIFSAASLLI